VHFLDVFEYRIELAFRADIDQIAAIVADHRPIGWDDDHFQVVNALEFVGLSIGRTGHTGKLVVKTEIVLERDRRQRLAFLLDRHAFFRFSGLMQAVGPAPTGHHAAGEFIDDDDLAAADDVLNVALVQVMRT